MNTPMYDELVDWVVERSATLRAAAEGHLEAAVPGCPGWFGRDLVAHLGEVQRFWAAAVAAGPAEQPPDLPLEPVPGPDAELLRWAAAATDELAGALRATPPHTGAWTWWGEPRRAEAIARHQVQEAAVHAWDAQSAAGHPSPLPESLAQDGVDEFLGVPLRSAGPWPYPPATVSVVCAGVEQAWVLRLGAEQPGSPLSVVRDEPDGDAVIRGKASDLVLAFYRRQGPDRLVVDGDAELASRLLGWPNLD